ncbi:FAD-dependent monooxygenase [Alienimonas sp. DA493]|uniref:FAD-dependent monooxygenase n=1 Tax=Alienimonas sp. DA493 TaxID=3373605 RepID=UPI003754A764
MRAIVVGAGIGGLTAALALRRAGAEVAVFERAPELTEIGAGISLWVNALRALEQVGAGDAARAAALPVTRTEFRIRRGRTVTASFDMADFERRYGTAPFVTMIHRAELVAALADLLPADTLRFGATCVGVEPGEPDGGRPATVRFEDGRTEQASLIVGADGIRSAVRAATVDASEPRYAGYTCWRGVCPRPAAVEPGYLAEWWGRGQRFGITTLPGDRSYWWATQNAPPRRQAANKGTAGERAAAAAAFADWAEPVPGLIDATPAGAVVRHDILDRPPTRRWTAGRVVLIGDAAHPTTPNFGQGGCLAIEDGVVLARRLAGCLHGGGAPLRAALDGFVAERFPRTKAVTNESWRFGRIGQWEGRWVCRARDAAVKTMLPLIGSRSLPKYAAFDAGPLLPPGAEPPGAESEGTEPAG